MVRIHRHHASHQSIDVPGFRLICKGGLRAAEEGLLKELVVFEEMHLIAQGSKYLFVYFYRFCELTMLRVISEDINALLSSAGVLGPMSFAMSGSTPQPSFSLSLLAHGPSSTS